MAMPTPPTSCNAWIFLEEDDPSGSNYNTPGSSYQNAVQYGVYASTDFLNLCWVNTVATSATTIPAAGANVPPYTIQLQQSTHPGGISNQQYMTNVMNDARAANPNIKILVTLGYAADEITQIFGSDQSKWQAEANGYAANVVAYLEHYGLDGFDVDWEPSFSDSGNSTMFNLVFSAIRAAFPTGGKQYYLTISPSEVGYDGNNNPILDGTTVNNCFDFVNLQLYGGAEPSEFTQPPVNVAQNLLAYGAKFEPDGGYPYQTAQAAYDGYTQGGYNVVTQWRLNSGNFQYEQAQQMILYQLVHGEQQAFDDTNIVGAAGNPPITSLLVQAGEVLDGVQATNTAATLPGQSVPGVFQMPLHGGTSGNKNTVTVPEGYTITSVTGFTGDWFGWNCVLQITITASNGTTSQTLGTFGSMANSSNHVAFTLASPSQSVIAFSGSIVNVPLARGGRTNIIQSLNCTFA